MAFDRTEFMLAQGHATGSNGLRQKFIYSTDDTYTGGAGDDITDSDYFALVGDSANNSSGTGEIQDGDIIEVWVDQAGTPSYAAVIVTNDGSNAAAVTVANIVAEVAY